MMDAPNTKYQMIFRGQWRPVTNMFDGRKDDTFLPMHATSAVLWIAPLSLNGPAQWVAIEVSPGDIVERPGHRTTEWETLY